MAHANNHLHSRPRPQAGIVRKNRRLLQHTKTHAQHAKREQPTPNIGAVLRTARPRGEQPAAPSAETRTGLYSGLEGSERMARISKA